MKNGSEKTEKNIRSSISEEFRYAEIISSKNRETPLHELYGLSLSDINEERIREIKIPDSTRNSLLKANVKYLTDLLDKSYGELISKDHIELESLKYIHEFIIRNCKGKDTEASGVITSKGADISGRDKYVSQATKEVVRTNVTDINPHENLISVEGNDTDIEPFMRSYKREAGDTLSRAIFKSYPLLGDYIVGAESYEALFNNAKKAIDQIIKSKENKVPVPEYSLKIHEQITLAVIQIAKEWNNFEEGKFSKYVAMQFGYRDDNGKVWNIITNSLYKAFTMNSRLFIRRERGDREFFETVMVHSFGPARAWFPLLDLLFAFYKDNLEWNYIPGDPLFGRVVDVLKRRFNNAGVSDEEFLIASKSYLLRVGIKRLVQEAPFYCAKLFENIVSRIDQLVNNSASDSRRYSMDLVDKWFIEKISSSSEISEKNHTNKEVTEVALDYKSISPKYIMKSDGVYLSIPSIRLQNVGHEAAVASLYADGKLVQTLELTVRGNELGETIRGTKIRISHDYFSGDNLNITLVISDENGIIYDSDNKLFRKVLTFSDEKEVNQDKLRKESYYFFTSDPAKLTGSNVDIDQYSEGISKVSLHKDYTLLYAGELISMDILEIKDLRIVKPDAVNGAIYYLNGREYRIIEPNTLMSIYPGSEALLKRYHVTVNNKTYALSDIFDKNDKNRAVIRFNEPYVKEYSVKIIDLESNKVVSQDNYYSFDSIECYFDKKIYVSKDEIKSARAKVIINGSEREAIIMPDDQIAIVDYNGGTICFDIPSLMVVYDNTELSFGRYIIVAGLDDDSAMRFINKTGQRFELDYDEHVLDSPKELLLKDMAKQCGGNGKELVDLVIRINDRTVSVGTLIYKDTFVNGPKLIYSNNELCWDGGMFFIGDNNSVLEVVLNRKGEKKQVFPLYLGETLIASFSEGEFKEGNYKWGIRNASSKEILYKGRGFLGSTQRARFYDRVININYVTEDIELSSKRIEIKPVSIDSINFLGTMYVDSEEDVFDVYSGRMYWTNFYGEKKSYSFHYDDKRSKYKVNPVKIIYINKRFLRIINDDDEGIYCYYNDTSRQPGYEITDREPSRNDHGNYFDILYYEYEVESNGSEVEEKLEPEKAEPVYEACYQEVPGEPEKPKETSYGIDEGYEHEIMSLFDSSDMLIGMGEPGRSIKDSLIVSQQEVISAPAEKRLFINAGPGTGKTWTLIEKIIYLVNELEMDPETIQVLTFSRSATEVIRKRMQDAIFEGRADLTTNYVDIRTFDSYASQLLYWVKDSDYDLIPVNFAIERLNYEDRINKFIEIIKKEPDLISQCKHLIVDEVQDLVMSRAEMVLEMIDAIPEDSGVTLLGDACQAIYDYQVDDYSIGAEKFFDIVESRDDFSFYSFTENHRQTGNLQAYSEEYRTPIINKDINACNDCLKVIKRNIPDYDIKNIKYFEEDTLDRLTKEGNVGMLTRSNAQALEIDSILKRKNINHIINRRLEDQYYNSWIADLFNNTEKLSFNESDFANEIHRYVYDAFEENDINEIWNDISSWGKHSTGSIQNKDILSAILKTGKCKALFIKERDAAVTVSTIHRSKGKEYDSVLILDDLLSPFSNEIEEQRVNYVALTRAKDHIYKVDMPDKRFRTLESGRCYSWHFGAKGNTLTDFEIGIRNDYVPLSFCKDDNIQEYIRENRRTLPGQEVYLERTSDKGVVYDIVLRKNNLRIGKTSSTLAADLKTAIRATKNLPQNANIYDYLYPKRFSGLYVMDVASEIGICLGDEKGIKEFGDMITWNTLIPYGYARAEY